jgi:histidine triad (HIT) family protein
MNCPFCDYEGPSPIIADYKQEGVFIIEPLNPVVPNHVLVIPRRHVEHFANHLEVTGKVAQVAADYARGRWDTDFNLITSKGPAATQTVKHLHFHLVPRQEGDGLQLPWTARSEKPSTEQERCTCQVTTAAYGMDPRCPVHGEAKMSEKSRRGDELAVANLTAALQAADGQIAEYESALRAIRGPEDQGVWIGVYREAGGGYQGLQAIAESALDPASTEERRRWTLWRWPESQFVQDRAWQLAMEGEDIPSLAEVITVEEVPSGEAKE